MGDVPPPDYCLDVVLEEDGVRKIGEIGCRSQVIDNGTVEMFSADHVFEKGSHPGRMERTASIPKGSSGIIRCGQTEGTGAGREGTAVISEWLSRQCKIPT